MDIIWTWIMDLIQYVDTFIKYVIYLELLNQIPKYLENVYKKYWQGIRLYLDITYKPINGHAYNPMDIIWNNY